MIIAAILLFVIPLIIYGILKVREKQRYFKDMNIKHMKPVFFFGSVLENIMGKIHISALVERTYSSFPGEEVIGMYQFVQPLFVICSPQMVQDVLIKDFSHFTDRMIDFSQAQRDTNEEIFWNLFLMCGKKWRVMRYKFSPLFTTGKLRYMFNSIKECSSTLKEVLEKDGGREINSNDTMSGFTMDVIGSCAFGLDPQAQTEPESKFKKMAQWLVAPTPLLINLKFGLLAFAPKVFNFLKLTPNFFPKEPMDYFCDLISTTIETRKRQGLERNDFVQMLLQLQEKGKIEIAVHDKSDDYLLMEDTKDEMFELKLTNKVLVGGAFSFLFAGFHASAMTLTFTLFEIAQRPEVLGKIREELKENIGDDDITFDHLKKLSYLEKVLKEVMRHYPTVSAIFRRCTKDYTFRNGIQIKEGMNVLIPVSALHKDPAYYAEPTKFNPDRFDHEPVPGTYLPFGDGPRICIAMRFAMMELKFALVEILRNYDIELSENTLLPLKFDPRIFLTTPLNPVIFNLKKITI